MQLNKNITLIALKNFRIKNKISFVQLVIYNNKCFIIIKMY